MAKHGLADKAEPGTRKNRPEIVIEECKGCGRCQRACPHQLLQLDNQYNRRGYHYAKFSGGECTGCGLCFYSCPEPHAIMLMRKLKNQD